MEVSKVRTVRGYRAMLGVLAALLLSLPAHAAWKTMATPPVPTGSAAAESINGLIYVAGGASASGKNSTLPAFNPTTKTWTTLARMPLTLYQGDGAGGINSQPYVAGGWKRYLPPHVLLKDDPPSHPWAPLPALPHP